MLKKNISKDESNEDIVTNSLQEMVTYAKHRSNFKENDRINIVVRNPKFFYTISSGYEKTDAVKRLTDKMIKILTSDKAVNLSDCVFTVVTINMPRGLGRACVINVATDCRTKQCILRINNTDNLCAARAIITGLTYHTDTILGTKLTYNDIYNIRHGRKLQTELAQELCSKLDSYCEEGFTLDDIKNVEELLDIQVKIVCAQNFNTIIYQGREEKDVKIYLYKNGNHFDLITKMNAFFAQAYYCKECDKPYNKKDKHICKKKKKEMIFLTIKKENTRMIILKLFFMFLKFYFFIN